MDKDAAVCLLVRAVVYFKQTHFVVAEHFGSEPLALERHNQEPLALGSWDFFTLLGLFHPHSKMQGTTDFHAERIPAGHIPCYDKKINSLENS